MQIIKIFCYSHTRFYYCKFSTSKIEQHQPTNKSTKKNNFYSSTTKKRGKKAPLKIQHFKKNFKKSLFTRVEKKIIFLHIFVVIVKKVYICIIIIN